MVPTPSRDFTNAIFRYPAFCRVVRTSISFAALLVHQIDGGVVHGVVALVERKARIPSRASVLLSATKCADRTGRQ